MDRKIQICAKEEPAEGQGTEKKTEYLDPEVYVCLNLHGFYTLAGVNRPFPLKNSGRDITH